MSYLWKCDECHSLRWCPPEKMENCDREVVPVGPDCHDCNKEMRYVHVFLNCPRCDGTGKLPPGWEL